MREATRPKTKREAIREKRRREQRRKRLMVVLAIAGVALLVTALLIAPTIQNAITPVGDIVLITPMPRLMEDGTALGDPNAPVLIENYEDFQCSACKIFADNVEPFIFDNHVATGEVYYVFRHFPFLDDRVPTNESNQAANASMCAAEQDRFWDYHDILFANLIGTNQGSFTDRRLVAFAEALELDVDSFNACFEENRYRDEIEADLRAGRALNVSGTPTVFVNGEMLTPGRVPSYQDVRQAIEAALSAPDS
jgi:protein-disulfide isomerase